MLYSRSFIESCREHKPITGTALEASLDAPESVARGGLIKKNFRDEHGDVVVENVVIGYVWRGESNA